MLPLYGAQGLADFPKAFPTELVVRAASEWRAGCGLTLACVSEGMGWSNSVTCVGTWIQALMSCPPEFSDSGVDVTVLDYQVGL